MAKEEGIVLRVTQTGMASVQTVRPGACKSCTSRHMCHGGNVKDEEVMAINAANAKPGDRIQITFETSSLIKATFLLYVFPIIWLLAGALIGQHYAPAFQMNPSALAAIVGFGFFGAAILFVKILGNHLATKESYRPKITRVLRKKRKEDAEGDDEGQEAGENAKLCDAEVSQGSR